MMMIFTRTIVTKASGVSLPIFHFNFAMRHAERRIFNIFETVCRIASRSTNCRIALCWRYKGQRRQTFWAIWAKPRFLLCDIVHANGGQSIWTAPI